MIDHHVLEDLLRKHFVGRHLFNLYWKFVKAGYVEYDGKKQKYVAADMGVPQGGILSPLLSNVILHEFDMFIERRRREYQSASLGHQPSIRNKAYFQLSSIIKKCKEHDLRDELREARQLRKRTRYVLPNPNYTRIEYVRYADD